MDKIKLDLQNKTVEDKIADGKEVSDLMQKDANQQIKDAGKALEEATKELEKKNTERAEAKAIAESKTEALGKGETSWDNADRKAAAKTMEIFPDDVEKWKSFGWELADTTTAPVGELPAPKNLAVTQGDAAGELDCHWDKVEGANHYNVRISKDVNLPIAQWSIAATPTKSSVTLKNLESNVVYWISVSAMGTIGESAPSDPFRKNTN